VEAIAVSARPTWEGFLKFNLLAVPVKAYNATVAGGGRISFHLIHKECNSRIRYQKVCPIHGEVPKDEIVTAYQVGRGQYIVVNPEELDKLHTENEKAINIDSFIHAAAIDPIYFGGRTYYLVPSGRVAQKPYAVLQEVMAAKQRFGIAQVVMSGRENLAVVRPYDGLLAMTFLNYAAQIKKPNQFEDEVVKVDVSSEERKLAETLIETATSEEFDLGQYRDEYTTKLKQLIDAKAKGQRIVAPQPEQEPHVINLMDALRQSLEKTKKGAGSKGETPANGKPHSRGRKRAASESKRKTA
jgi:DNA end-binding protein Ku